MLGASPAPHPTLTSSPRPTLRTEVTCSAQGPTATQQHCASGHAVRPQPHHGPLARAPASFQTRALVRCRVQLPLRVHSGS